MDDASCAAPSGKQHYTFGLSPKTLALIVAPIIAFMPAFVIWGIPAIWARFGIFLGRYLRGKTEGRHNQVLQTIEDDERSYAEKHVAGKEANTKTGEHSCIWEEILLPSVLQTHMILTS